MPFEVDRVVGVVKGGTLRKNSSITEDVHIIRTAADNVDRLVFLRSTKKKKKRGFYWGKRQYMSQDTLRAELMLAAMSARMLKRLLDCIELVMLCRSVWIPK